MTKHMTDPELALWLLARNSQLKNERSTWDTYWQDIANFVHPRKGNIVTKATQPRNDIETYLFDSTAVYSNAVLANGQLSYMTPAESRWFTFDPPRELQGSDIAEQWFHECSEIAQAILATTNFYSAIHELFFDDGSFGTTALLCTPGRRTPLFFREIPVGSFSIAEDSEGFIDSLFYECEYTARQAEQEFGLENLSPKLRKEVEEGEKNGKQPDTPHCFLHAIYPRKEDQREPGKLDGRNKPWASVYVETEQKHICRNSGFDEQPFFGTRHLKTGDAVYGWSPAWIALPEARQVNFLTKNMDALAELKAFPRFLMPEDMNGEIDLRPGGGTYFDPNKPNAVPKEWMTQGDYAVGQDRERMKKEAIERAFHVDLFRMFAGLDKQMTAREVAERSSEKLIQFTPAFARKTTELFNPLLRRVFSILLRNGLFPFPPAEAMIPSPVTGEPEIAEPEIVYTSRVALAIKALHNISFVRTMELIGPMAEARPEILDNFDLDKISREAARNDGLPADWLVPKDQVAETRAARAEAMAKEQAKADALAAAETAQKAGSVKRDSVLAGTMENAA